MIKTGIDIVEIKRIENAVKKHKNFIERNFSSLEEEYLKSVNYRCETIAGMFAAKEAYSKFLGTGISGFSLKDIEVLHTSEKKPYIVFKGVLSRADLSISHSDDNAISVVCGEEEKIDDIKNISEMKKLLPKRKKDVNKGNLGKLLILGGSKGMTGAVCLSANAALRSGAGLVTVATPDSQRQIVAIKLTEAMTVGFSDKDGNFLGDDAGKIIEYANGFDCLVIGPGMGRTLGVDKIVNGVLAECKTPVVIDADGINAVSKNIDILKNIKAEAVITPHPGEMSRLTKKTISEIQENRTELCREFAKENNIVTVLKGSETVIASPDGRYVINSTGNSGLATGGTGDVLSGIIASFIGQGLNMFDAAVLAVYLHGRAGDLAEKEKSVYGLIASDVIDFLPFAIRELLD